MQLPMKKYKQEEENFVFKEENMRFRVTSLQDSPFTPMIISATMWPRISRRARRET